jgi:hypothetical protein
MRNRNLKMKPISCRENRFTHSLNAICAYFTMFPLDFPLNLFRRNAKRSEWVLDPFCGRGTTNFAARLLGMPSVGIDSSPVATAIAQAKMVYAPLNSVLRTAEALLKDSPDVARIPRAKFWKHAYAECTLLQICRLRDALLADCTDPAQERIISV